jgi:hypothetical protein
VEKILIVKKTLNLGTTKTLSAYEKNVAPFIGHDRLYKPASAELYESYDT